MMRREVVLSVGGYPASIAEDYNLWEKLGCTIPFSNLPDRLLDLRRHDESLISTRNNKARILQDSALISQRRITKILGEDVPIALVEKMWGTPFQKSEDALQIADLICKLALASTSEVHLATHERRNINNDAAKRVLKILARPNISQKHRWQIFRMAHRLDYFVIARTTVKRISRAIRDLTLV